MAAAAGSLSLALRIERLLALVSLPIDGGGHGVPRRSFIGPAGPGRAVGSRAEEQESNSDRSP